MRTFTRAEALWITLHNAIQTDPTSFEVDRLAAELGSLAAPMTDQGCAIIIWDLPIDSPQMFTGAASVMLEHGYRTAFDHDARWDRWEIALVPHRALPAWESSVVLERRVPA